jgi:hypothetical protein
MELGPHSAGRFERDFVLDDGGSKRLVDHDPGCCA